jgi:hypothetical protein
VPLVILGCLLGIAVAAVLLPVTLERRSTANAARAAAGRPVVGATADGATYEVDVTVAPPKLASLGWGCASLLGDSKVGRWHWRSVWQNHCQVIRDP